MEQQALGTIGAESEMKQPLDHLILELKATPGYGGLFEAAHPGEGISCDTTSKAITSFGRTVISTNSPFDR